MDLDVLDEQQIMVEDGMLYLPLAVDAPTDRTVDAEYSRIESLDSLDAADTTPSSEPICERDGQVYVEAISLESLVASYDELKPERYKTLKQQSFSEIQDEFKDEYMPVDSELETLVFDVLPYFVDTRDGIDDERSKEEQVIDRVEEAVDDEVASYYEEVDALFDINNIEHKITRVEDTVTGDRRREKPEGSPDTATVRDWIEQEVEDRIYREEIERLRDILEERKDLADRNRDRLATLLMVDDHDEVRVDDFVIEDADDGYWAAVETGEYALRGFDGDVYRFPSARVGVHTTHLSTPRVLNYYKHPFLSNHDRRQDICLGDARAPTNEFSGEHVIDAIDTGVTIITQGYFNEDDFFGYHSLDGEVHNGGNYSITFEDYRVKERSLDDDVTITNEFIDADGGLF